MRSEDEAWQIAVKFRSGRSPGSTIHIVHKLLAEISEIASGYSGIEIDTALTQPSLRPSEWFVYLTIYIAARNADVVQSRIAQALKLASLACPPPPIRDALSEVIPTE